MPGTLAQIERYFEKNQWEFAEIVVVNDGSPDDTSRVLAPLAEQGRIRYFEQSNQGHARGGENHEGDEHLEQRDPALSAWSHGERQ